MMSGVERTLNSAGSTNFVDCFDARQKSNSDLKESEVESLCQKSRNWKPRSLTTIKNAINQIFRENCECEALKICCEAKNLPRETERETKEKARKLYEKYCNSCRSSPETQQKMRKPHNRQRAPDPVTHARSVIEIEAAAVAALGGRVDARFEKACGMLLNCRGRVAVTGMGKSGHIGGKIASTLASTGTPAFFVHPGEASHGDLGMITPHDVALVISNSGETAEVVAILPIIKRIGGGLVTMTGKPDSTLGRQADACLDTGVEKEACPHNLAPTASTTAALVMGDALAVAVQLMRGFSAQDFARTHPGGVLGKRLLLYASDLMHTGDELPLVSDDATLRQLVLEMSSKSLGMAGVVDAGGKLIGMFTDGDLRRALSRKVDIYNSRAVELMTPQPFTIRPDMLAEEIVTVMRQFAQRGPHAVNGVFVVDDGGRVVGALNTHDLLKAGVI